MITLRESNTAVSIFSLNVVGGEVDFFSLFFYGSKKFQVFL